MGRNLKRYCKYGHDVAKVGRYPSGRCKACAVASAYTRYQQEKVGNRFSYEELGSAPGLREWRRSLGLTLKELSMECGLISRKTAELGYTPRVPIRQLIELEGGREAKASTRLLIAQTLWGVEQRMRDEKPNDAERLRAAGVA